MTHIESLSFEQQLLPVLRTINGRESTVQIYAMAGGAGLDDAGVLTCCGICPILPLFILAVLFGATRNSLWAASLALLISGVPFTFLVIVTANYEPSEDWEVVSDQDGGWAAIAFYAVMTSIAALTFVLVVGRRLQRLRNAPSANQKSEEIGEAQAN